MPKKSVALLTLHGMGDTPKNYHHLFLERIKKQIGEKWGQVAFNSLYYQDILQINQNEIYRKMKPHIDWRDVRKFILYGFSDAASLDYQKDRKNSLYHKTQIRIASALQSVYRKHGNIPVVIVAYSLGCHVLSNYIWDAQQPEPDGGVWVAKNNIATNQAEEDFMRLKNLHALFTLGCNIPVFVAGYKDIEPFQKPHKKFKWVNLYDKDDVLGWPLEPLSKSYRKLVKDVPINASEKLSDLLLKSWNPLSHESYFGDKKVIQTIHNKIIQFM